MSTKRVVVTGVSRGLGRAMVEGFIGAGHIVSGCARSAEAIAELQDQYHAPHRFDVVDVTSDSVVELWAKEVLADGPVDLLINNAATINGNAPLWEVPNIEFDGLVDINIKGNGQRYPPLSARHGRARQSGVVVNFSSAWGRSTSA